MAFIKKENYDLSNSFSKNMSISYKKIIMMKKIFSFLIIACAIFSQISAQTFSAQTSIDWDHWRSNKWGYLYSGDWIYAVEGMATSELLEHGNSLCSIAYLKPVGNARDFYFRFNYRELGLHELSRKEWREVKKNGGWVIAHCTFEYYITDQYPSIKNALEKESWPCAKYYLRSGKPAVLKRENVRTLVHYTQKNEIQTLNFHFVEGNCDFGISVVWGYNGKNMKYIF